MVVTGWRLGVDGFIELRDPATRQMLARWIGVQVKTTADGSYTSEDETGFSYLLKPKDLEYWRASNVPVIIGVGAAVRQLHLLEARWRRLADRTAPACVQQGGRQVRRFRC